MLSPRALLITQGSTWLVLAIIFGVRIGLATGPDVYPRCPFVLDQIFKSDGYPVTPAGYAAAIVTIGVGWFLTGVLMLIQRRFPRFFLWIQVAVSRTGAPVALRAGLFTFAVGASFLGALQLSCLVG